MDIEAVDDAIEHFEGDEGLVEGDFVAGFVDLGAEVLVGLWGGGGGERSEGRFRMDGKSKRGGGESIA